MITTFLSTNEQNIPIKNIEITKLLAEIRDKTKENWQVLEIEHSRSPSFFRKSITTFSYEVYFEVGGCAPFQIINFYRDNTGTTLNIGVSAELVVAYFYGILSGIHLKEGHLN